MAIKDKFGQRNETLKMIFHSSVWQQIGKNGKVAYSLFSDKIQNLTTIMEDSLTQNGEATNITEAFKSLKQTSALSNLQAVVLVTDGNSTVGMNPLYEAKDLNVPVFTIGIGDTSEQKDILIRKVLTNEIAYIGAKTPVNIMVHSTGFSGERLRVSVKNDVGTIDEKYLTIENNVWDCNIPLFIIPEKEGEQKYTVEISNLPGELTHQNNRMSFFIKVLKNKMNIALIAGTPCPDAAFIRRALMDDKNIEVQTFIEMKNGNFANKVLNVQGLKEVDCIILIGYQTTYSNTHSLQAILDVASAGKPLFIVLSRIMDFGKLKTLESILPFKVENVTGNEYQGFAVVTESQQLNSIMKAGTGVNVSESWSKLPPVFCMHGDFRAKIESQILATIHLQSMPFNEPFIIARNINQKKSMAVLGYGLWRWKMLSDVSSGTTPIFDNFIGNSIRWLTTQEDAQKIRVQTSKHIYTTQEAIEYTAQVYDDNYQPIEDAQIEINMQHKKEINTISLNPLGSGQYEASLNYLQEGDYNFTATVTENGMVVGSDKGTFSVGGINAEYLETRMNKPLLQQIAAQTGGIYYDNGGISMLACDITALPNFKTLEISKSENIEIWNSIWMFALIVLVFAVEWFLRKRYGML